MSTSPTWSKPWKVTVFSISVVTLLLGAFAAGAAAVSVPPSGSGVSRTVWGATQPDNAPGQTLTVARVTVAPGAHLATHFHEGTQFARITEGTLTYHIISGTAEVTTAEGLTTYASAPTVLRLTAGSTLVEKESLIHWAENRGRVRVRIELSSLLRSGSPASTPVGGGETPSLHIEATLSSTGTLLHTVNENVLYGWNNLVGTGAGPDGPVSTDMQGSVSYTGGEGGFSGFITFTFENGSTIGTRMEGSATKVDGGTDFQATLVVLGGTGDYLGTHGSGIFIGSRSGIIGSPVISDFDLYLD